MLKYVAGSVIQPLEFLASLLARKQGRHRADEPGPVMFEHACRMGLEGIVSKRRDTPYVAGRLVGPGSADGPQVKCRPSRPILTD
jgi:hypothetical protein